MRSVWMSMLLAAMGSLVWLGLGSSRAEEKPQAEPVTSKEALSELNPLIGEWRGVGMPKRGSRDGAWIEQAEWVWEFDKDQVAIRYVVTKEPKLLESALVTWNLEKKQFEMTAKFSGDIERSYIGERDENKLILETPTADEAGEIYRVTITQLNEKRTLVLHEKRKAEGSFYSRVAEVGYTRAGTSLAVSGQGEPVCIVTGGKGTISVSYEGKTYYVCCTGCKQAFDDDPKGIIEAYLAEQKEKSSD